MRESLGLSGLPQLQARQKFSEALGPGPRGQAVVEVRDLLPRGRSLLFKLLAAGETSGLWGAPRIFDSFSGRNDSPRFAQGMRSPPWGE